ncbi:MAG TPA: CYTH domain-containing protein [Solirubrobacterales bacterium]
MEIERKFLIESAPGWLPEWPSERIEQGYLTESVDSVQVRVRRKDGEAILGVKRGTGLSREETEVALAAGAAGELWELTEGRRVRKARYRVDHEGMTIEVDVFTDELEGLVVAEVEFDTEEASAEFTGPEWLGREVTGERAYENECLAEEGLPEEPR